MVGMAPPFGGVIKFRWRCPVSLSPPLWAFRCLAVCRRRCRGGVGGAAAVTLDVHLEDRGMMDEPVDGGDGHGLVGEDDIPPAERLIGRDHDRTPLVSGGDQFEQRARFGLVFPDIGEVVEE